LVLMELPSNAEVFLGSTKLTGSINDGVFRSDKIDVGPSQVSVKVPNATTVALPITFSAGDSVSRRWSEFRPTWPVTLSCTVANCEISVSQGQAAPEKISAGIHQLSPGSYTFTGSAVDHDPDRKAATIPGDTSVELKPKPRALPIAAPPPPPPPPPTPGRTLNINDLKPSCFMESDKKDFFKCKESRVSSGYGTHKFEIEVKEGGPFGVGARDGKWVVASKEKSIEFTLEGKSLQAVARPTGNKLSGITFDKSSTIYKVEIIISAGTIEQRITANPGTRVYSQKWDLSGPVPDEFRFRGDNFVRNYSFTEAK